MTMQHAAPVSGRSFTPALPGDALTGIQAGTMRYRYRERALLKNPFDLALYLRLLGQLRPQTVIEVGSAEGGSAMERGRDYAIDTDICDYSGFNVTYAPNGWLKRT